MKQVFVANARLEELEYRELYIQRMPGRSYRDIMADAGYEKVGNYLYLKAHGQNCYIKPTDYPIRKNRKYKQQIWRTENMEYLEREDCFVCA